MSEQGFTLIELLVTVAIIGILAAIAVPQFEAYKERAFNTRAQSDLKNIIVAQESYFTDSERYTDDISLLSGFDSMSDGVNYQLFNSFGSDDIFGAFTYHTKGTNTYCYISDDDSAIRTESGTPCALGDCIY